MIGITTGDAAGIGPEITLKSVAGMSADERAATRDFGCLATLRAAQVAAGTGLRLGRDVAVTDLPVEVAPLPFGRADPRGRRRRLPHRRRRGPRRRGGRRSLARKDISYIGVRPDGEDGDPGGLTRKERMDLARAAP